MAKSQTEYANEILDLMKSNNYSTAGGFSITTPSLAEKLDIPDTSRDTLLKCLDKLHLVGVLEKAKSFYGGKSWRWRLKVETWNRSNPFMRTGITDIAQAPTPPKPPPPPPPSEELQRLQSRVADLEETVKELQEQEGQSVRTLEVKRWDAKVTTLENVVLPKLFPKVLALAACRRNILLVGPAGSGKSHLGKLIADSLDLQFGAISCTAGMSESHLLGRVVPDLTHGKNRFQGTDFLRCYEDGGVFLLDEIDAADPNLLLAVNSALANGYCNVPNRPDKPQAKQHKDFVCIATANTFGRGATRVYSGRNQLDEATLDRFRIGTVEVTYDLAVERSLCPDDVLRHELQAIRNRIERTGLRRIMSTRFIRDAYVMKEGAGWGLSEILETYFEGWTAEEKAKVAP